MKNRIGILTLLILVTTASHAQKFILSSLWRDSVIAVDGSPDDWDQPYRYFDSKSKLQYSIVNDTKYIYVSVKTNDPKAQMKIMRAGMDVWFDTKGKKKEMAIIHFPLKTDPKLDMNPDPSDPEQQTVEKPDIKKMRLDWSTSGKDIHTQGFKDIPVSITQADSTKYGIQAAIDWDRYDNMTYELKVPFSAFYKDQLAPADTVKPITIGIKANAMDLPMMPTNSAADVTGAAGGNSAINSGTTNTGMNGGMPNNINANNRPQTSSPQPTLAIPRAAADMGVPLLVTMKIKLAYK
jgi:hypothetical protein